MIKVNSNKTCVQTDLSDVIITNCYSEALENKIVIDLENK